MGSKPFDLYRPEIKNKPNYQAVMVSHDIEYNAFIPNQTRISISRFEFIKIAEIGSQDFMIPLKEREASFFV